MDQKNCLTSSCAPVVIGSNELTLQASALVNCGSSLLVYESEGPCVTVTGQGQVNIPTGGVACTSVLEFVRCDGSVVRKVLPNPVPPQVGIVTPGFTVSCVRQIIFHCEATTGGTGCVITFRYAVSFCEEKCQSLNNTSNCSDCVESNDCDNYQSEKRSEDKDKFYPMYMYDKEERYRYPCKNYKRYKKTRRKSI